MIKSLIVRSIGEVREVGRAGVGPSGKTGRDEGFERVYESGTPLRIVKDLLVIGEIATDELYQEVCAKALKFISSTSSTVQNRNSNNVEDASRVGFDKMAPAIRSSSRLYAASRARRCAEASAQFR